MKALMKILMFTVAFCLFYSCTKYEVTVPFKADFVGTYMYAGPDASCGEWNPDGGVMWGMVINEGTGTGTYIGKFSNYFEFCCEFVSGIYPANHMVAYFTAANGDILYVSCAGQVLNGRLDYHPDDVNSYFKDPFVILGGTGKFEGATGSGYTDDYNRDSYPDNSFHHWKGTITLVKGTR